MKKVLAIDGLIIVLVIVTLIALFGYQIMSIMSETREFPLWSSAWRLLILLFMFKGFKVLDPNEISILTFFGNYQGMIDQTGFTWTLPWYSEYSRLSKAIETHESKDVKATDKSGSPIIVGGIVKYKVVDPYKATFETTNIGEFVDAGTNAAFRELASHYSYADIQTQHSKADETLKGSLNKRFASAGLEVIDADIVDFSYSTEIASQMLQKQGAQAIISARTVIAEGAVSVVRDTIKKLEESGITFNNEQKAQFAANLVLVMVGDSRVTPTINV